MNQKNKKREKRFQVILTDRQDEMITWLKGEMGCSKGMIIRNAVMAVYSVVHDHKAICADSHPCLVPQMRQYSSIQTATPEERKP